MNSKILVKVTGKNLNKFILNLSKKKIEIEKIIYQEKSIIILLNKTNYHKLKELKTSYKIKIIKYYGILYLFNVIKKNKLIFFCIFINILMLFLLSNTILKIEIVHNNKELKSIILEELNKNNIKKFSLTKSFKEQEKIVNIILEKYKDKIEWLELEKTGTKYTVRLEERKIINKKEDTLPKDIIANRNGLVKKIIAETGDVLIELNDYVKKGDILISGSIKNKDTVVDKIKATGKVYAETWYTATVELPSFYKEEILTNNSNLEIELNMFNKILKLNNKYKFSKNKSLFSIKNSLLPISFTINNSKEINLKEEIYVESNAIIKAISLAEEKINKKLSKEEYILYRKGLKKTEENSKIIVVIFLKVYENIAKETDIIEIEEPKVE